MYSLLPLNLQLNKKAVSCALRSQNTFKTLDITAQYSSEIEGAWIDQCFGSYAKGLDRFRRSFGVDERGWEDGRPVYLKRFQCGKLS